MPELSFFFQIKTAQYQAVMSYLAANGQCARNSIENDLFFVIFTDALNPESPSFSDDANEREKLALEAMKIIDEHVQRVVMCN